MLDLLRPPTDNLYKFAALSGVAILFASAALTIPRAQQLELEVQQLAGEIALLTLERRMLEEGQEALARAAQDVEDEILEAYSDSIARQSLDREAILAWVDTARAESEQQDQVHRDLLRRGQELDNRVERTRMLTGQLRFMFVLGGGGFGVGLLLAVWGFQQWYVRVQLLQDAALRKLAEKPGDEGVSV